MTNSNTSPPPPALTLVEKLYAVNYVSYKWVDDTPDAYFSKIDSIITLLTDLGSTMDDDDIVTYASGYCAVAETCWLRNLLRELHTPLATATLVYCDNVSAVYLFSNPVQHQRTKHIEIDIHFVRDLVGTGVIRVLHVLSRYQYANILTKCLPTSLFDEFRTSLSVRSSPAPTAGGC
ncbi:ribonuclease H-like domain-containing protein [Tanacetum coccineum]